MSRMPGYLAKDRHVLTPKTIRTTHRLEKEKGQNKALKNVAFSRKVGLFTATVAAVEGRHWGPLAERLGAAAANLLTSFITQRRGWSCEFSKKKVHAKAGGGL
jgi:hypothetical protein